MTSLAEQTMSEAEYLAYSRSERTERLEYVDGFVYAQAGASKPHGFISSNILRRLLNASEGSGCYVIAADMKVRVAGASGGRRYYLPDIVVTCNSHMDGDTETAPCLLVEILSSSTLGVELTYKASDYQRLPSLQGHLLVDSERESVSLHRRTADGWKLELVESAVTLPCLDVTLQVEDIYKGVEL